MLEQTTATVHFVFRFVPCLSFSATVRVLPCSRFRLLAIFHDFPFHFLTGPFSVITLNIQVRGAFSSREVAPQLPC